MPAKPIHPSPEAQAALRAIGKLSERDRAWIYERIEGTQLVSVDELSPEWRAELQARARALQDGSVGLHDLEDVEHEALRLLEG